MIILTEASALRALRRRLVFGDEEQIAALNFLERLAAAKAAHEACGRKHDPHRKFCETCSCLKSFPEEIRRALKLKYESAAGKS